MTTTTLRLDHERLGLAVHAGLLLVLLVVMAAAAAVWAAEPFALLVLAIPFAGALASLVKLNDESHAHSGR
jgi:hypothetical protein